MQEDTLCIIPARGGSKRLPRKNILPLCGKPLMAYSIEAALQSGVFKDVVVSSDDDEILDIATSFGAKIDRRPESLSSDTVRAVEIIYEYLSRPTTSEKYQNIANILPTCPFRTAEDIRNSHDLFLKEKANREVFLVAVTKFDFPPQLALDLLEDGKTLHMRDYATYRRTTRSQDLGQAFHPNGAIYLSTVEGFLREKTFFSKPLIGYVMPEERSFDIDYEYQFKIAEVMMGQLNERGLHVDGKRKI